MPLCDACKAMVIRTTLHPLTGEDECAECRERREQAEAEAATERKSVWRDAPWTFAKNH